MKFFSFASGVDLFGLGMKQAGHDQVGHAEVESELIRHPSVIEAAVIGTPHPIKGEVLTCFVVIKEEYEMNDHLREELKDETTNIVGIVDPSEFATVDKEIEKKYNNEKPKPRPPHWSGWRVLPEEIEFWLDGEGRIHERLNYVKENGEWK